MNYEGRKIDSQSVAAAAQLRANVIDWYPFNDLITMIPLQYARLLHSYKFITAHLDLHP